MAAPDLEELYREIILDHYRRPRNRAEALDGETCSAEGANPLCGDQVRVAVRLEGDRLAEVAFGGSGCSISQASASMMTQAVRGHTVAEARAAAAAFQQMMLTGEPPAEDLGDVEALQGVAKFPARVKCASLAWKTLEQALAGETATGTAPAPVTTDERSGPDGRDDV